MINIRKSGKITRIAKAVLRGTSRFICRPRNDYDPIRQDQLTRLYNRIVFKQTRKRLDQYTLLVLDIDNFKSINKRYGQRAGDKVLKAISDVIRSETDQVFRVAGQKFAILVETFPFEAVRLGADILKRISTAHILEEQRITVSIGGAIYKKGKTHQGVFSLADKALYSAKLKGKNRLVAAV